MCPAGRFHCVSAGFARMPALKANPLRISSLALLMRNPGLIHIALKNRAICPAGRFHCVSAGFARMPVLKANPLRISSLALLMRNPGLTQVLLLSKPIGKPVHLIRVLSKPGFGFFGSGTPAYIITESFCVAGYMNI